jgi:hypothetical protein
MLTEAQLAAYHEDGFVIPDYRLPEDVVADIRSAHARLVDRYPEFTDYCPALLSYDLGFLNYARNPEILDLVAQVLGPDIALWNSSFFAKPARHGRKTPWHQDGEYWPIRPLATCTVWMAIDGATRANGCLRVIHGSHKEARLRPHHTNPSPDLTLNQELLLSEPEEAAAVHLEMEAGQISLHDVYLIHGSEANHSDRPRRGMTLRFMPTTSLYDRALESALYTRFGRTDRKERSIFLVRGTDRCGGNDFALRS